MLPAGRYFGGEGYRDVTNAYVVVLSSGEVEESPGRLACIELEECPLFGECCSRIRSLVDYNAQGYGVLTEEIPIVSPPNTVIRRLVIENLKISHTYLRDLRITAGWNGEEGRFVEHSRRCRR